MSPDITRITRRDLPARTSGTVLSEVRRPGVVGIDVPVPKKGAVKVEEPAPEPKKNPQPKTAASKPARNDGDVKVKGDG